MEKRFRLDLFQRLNVFPITLPPLKERKEDLAALIEFLTQKHNFHLREIDPRVLEVLSILDFEGNVRELENLIRRIICTKGASEGGIELNDLPKELPCRVTLNKSRAEGLEEEMAQYLLRKLVGEGQSLSEILDGCERIILKTVLQEAHGNRERAASILKTTGRTVFNKIQKHRLC